MKRAFLCFLTAMVLIVPFGCQKAGSDSTSKIGQRSSDQRLIVGTLNEKGEATYMSEEKIEAAFNSTFTAMVTNEVTVKKVGSDQYQLRIEATNTEDNSLIIVGFALDLMSDEIVLTTDQCIHSCTVTHSGCGCELTFSDCEGKCLCTDTVDLHCNHSVSSGTIPVNHSDPSFVLRSIDEFTKNLAVKS